MSTPDPDRFPLLGVPIHDTTQKGAIEILASALEDRPGSPLTVYFANAHTLNVAATDPDFAEVMARADHVFGDGTGVRWGFRMLRGTEPLENLNGTDLVPLMFSELAGRGLKYFLLGSSEEMIAGAARYAKERFTGWTLAGYHHGYVLDYDEAATQKLIDSIHASGADVLRVGRGNPLQENWIDRNRDRLRMPIAMAIGGQFAYWSGDLDRAPNWMRKLGIEWLHLMIRQPRKVSRYMLGNPLFLGRVLAQKIGLRSSAVAGLESQS